MHTGQRVERLLQRAQEVSCQLNIPAVTASIELARGWIGNLQGRWRRAVECCDRAEQTFRDHCTGVAFELEFAQTTALWCLNFVGDIAALGHRIPPQLAEARKRGQVATVTHVATLVLPVLAADDPDGAERELRRRVDRLSSEAFSMPHYNAFQAQIQIDLYRGDGDGACSHFKEQWPTLASSVVRLQMPRILCYYDRARCWLLGAATAANPMTLIRQAEKDARRIEWEQADWANPLADLIRAGIATMTAERTPVHRDSLSRAVPLLERAIARLETHDMLIFAAAARRRLGELLGGQAGQTLIAQAEAWMSSQKIVAPERIAALYVPGRFA
jgi:eukaryotic-like serine/threonine-protein kinase